MNCKHRPSDPSRALACEQRTESGGVAGHWIVENSYGRDLLVSRLRWLQLHRRLRVLRLHAKLLRELEQMIDELGFRDWAPPHTRIQRAQTALFFLAYNLRASFGFGAPDWRNRFAQGRG